MLRMFTSAGRADKAKGLRETGLAPVSPWSIAELTNCKALEQPAIRFSSEAGLYLEIPHQRIDNVSKR